MRDRCGFVLRVQTLVGSPSMTFWFRKTVLSESEFASPGDLGDPPTGDTGVGFAMTPFATPFARMDSGAALEHAKRGNWLMLGLRKENAVSVERSAGSFALDSVPAAALWTRDSALAAVSDPADTESALCENGTMILRPADHPELVADCDALHSARDALPARPGGHASGSSRRPFFTAQTTISCFDLTPSLPCTR